MQHYPSSPREIYRLAKHLAKALIQAEPHVREPVNRVRAHWLAWALAELDRGKPPSTRGKNIVAINRRRTPWI